MGCVSSVESVTEKPAAPRAENNKVIIIRHTRKPSTEPDSPSHSEIKRPRTPVGTEKMNFLKASSLETRSSPQAAPTSAPSSILKKDTAEPSKAVEITPIKTDLVLPGQVYDQSDRSSASGAEAGSHFPSTSSRQASTPSAPLSQVPELAVSHNESANGSIGTPLDLEPILQGNARSSRSKAARRSESMTSTTSSDDGDILDSPPPSSRPKPAGVALGPALGAINALPNLGLVAAVNNDPVIVLPSIANDLVVSLDHSGVESIKVLRSGVKLRKRDQSARRNSRNDSDSAAVSRPPRISITASTEAAQDPSPSSADELPAPTLRIIPHSAGPAHGRDSPTAVKAPAQPYSASAPNTPPQALDKRVSAVRMSLTHALPAFERLALETHMPTTEAAANVAPILPTTSLKPPTLNSEGLVDGAEAEVVSRAHLRASRRVTNRRSVQAISPSSTAKLNLKLPDESPVPTPPAAPSAPQWTLSSALTSALTAVSEEPHGDEPPQDRKALRKTLSAAQRVVAELDRQAKEDVVEVAPARRNRATLNRSRATPLYLSSALAAISEKLQPAGFSDAKQLLVADGATGGDMPIAGASLQRQGFAARFVSTAEDAIKTLGQSKFDVAVLDEQSLGPAFLEIVQKIRSSEGASKGRDSPIMSPVPASDSLAPSMSREALTLDAAGSLGPRIRSISSNDMAKRLTASKGTLFPKSARESGPAVPSDRCLVLVVGARQNKGDLSAYKQAGCDGFIEKGCGLADALNEVLRQKGSAPSELAYVSLSSSVSRSSPSSPCGPRLTAHSSRGAESSGCGHPSPLSDRGDAEAPKLKFSFDGVDEARL